MIKYLTPRSEEEIKNNILSLPCSFEKIQIAKNHNVAIPKKELNEYYKDAKDDKRLMKLMEKGKPIRNKVFRLKYPVLLRNIDNTEIVIDKCVFYLYNDAYISTSVLGLASVTNCVFKQC